VDPLVAEYHYGDYEGLTDEQILLLAPGWDIWRDGRPTVNQTEAVGARADAFLDAPRQRRTAAENEPEPHSRGECAIFCGTTPMEGLQRDIQPLGRRGQGTGEWLWRFSGW
jgi:broad specificity phosphatase PhoE